MRPIRVATTLPACAGLVLSLALGSTAAFALSQTPPPSDRELARAVAERLDRDPRLRTLALDVTARNGVVVLSGRAPTLADVLEARDLAFDVRGVSLVDSRIELDTRGRPDREIEQEILGRFRDRGELASLDVTVRDGAVLLTGTVADPRVRFVARTLAAGVPGVIGVADELRAPEMSDADVLSNVRDALDSARGARDAGLVTASVRDGIVVLEGRAPTRDGPRAAVERILALRGVRGVVNRVRVERD